MDQELRRIASQALAEMDGVESGFYLADGDRFAAHCFPTGGHGAGPSPAGTDPPPLESPYIRVQSQQSLDRRRHRRSFARRRPHIRVQSRQSLDLPPGEFLASARDVGPSRVVILTEPVGTTRPAPVVARVMVRLSGPADLKGKASRYAASTGLALGSVVLTLLLSWNLGRTLKRQPADQQRLRDYLRRSEHLATLGSLLAGVAHEVRNPLAAIRSTVQLWQRLPDHAHAPESMTAVIGAVDQLDALVTRLLHFSRADGGGTAVPATARWRGQSSGPAQG